MKLYNSLTKKVEVLTPLKNGEISLYTCGPTVYLSPTIGNWRTFLFYDTLARGLRSEGSNVNHVLNITDVGHLVSDADDGEDKLQKTAAARQQTAWEIAAEYTQEFVNGLGMLGIADYTTMPKATDHISEQIELVKSLEAKGHTYRIDDGIYFDISTFPNYTKLSHQDLEQLQAGARVAVDPQKRQPADFALWKFSPKNSQRDMEWDSPWGVGFPGWHLECSAMAMKYLGETIDVHAGGVDHIAIHHTNEIAQSEAATGKPFANLWAHGEFMLIDGRKMSKSLGNVYTLQDLTDRGFDPLAFRMLVLQTHYQKQLNFTWESLAAAQQFLFSVRMLAARIHQPDAEAGSPLDLDDLAHALKTAIQDNLDTPKALGLLAPLVDTLPTATLSEQQTRELKSFLAATDELLGLNLSSELGITNEQQELIARRNQARANKDFESADKLREELSEAGIGLNDTAAASYWYRLPPKITSS